MRLFPVFSHEYLQQQLTRSSDNFHFSTVLYFIYSDGSAKCFQQLKFTALSWYKLEALNHSPVTLLNQ